MKKTLRISVEMLDEASQSTFLPVFEVAKSRSVASWVLARAEEADVVCLSAATANSTPAGHRQHVRLWFAERVQVENLLTDGDVSIEPRNIRVVAVLSALDMAALRILDSSIFTQFNDSPSMVAARRDESAVPTTVGGEPVRYVLAHWPVLGGPFATRNYLNLAGMLTQRALSVADMRKFGGLTLAEADAFIVELARLGSLRKLASAERAKTQSNIASARSQVIDNVRRSGFLGRLRSWFASTAA